MHNFQTGSPDFWGETLPSLEKKLAVEFDPECWLINPIQHLEDQRLHTVFNELFEVCSERVQGDQFRNQRISQLFKDVSLDKRIRISCEESCQVFAEQAQEFDEGLPFAVGRGGGRIKNIREFTLEL